LAVVAVIALRRWSAWPHGTHQYRPCESFIRGWPVTSDPHAQHDFTATEATDVSLDDLIDDPRVYLPNFFDLSPGVAPASTHATRPALFDHADEMRFTPDIVPKPPAGRKQCEERTQKGDWDRENQRRRTRGKTLADRDLRAALRPTPERRAA
jgi:hypothetical protein